MNKAQAGLTHCYYCALAIRVNSNHRQPSEPSVWYEVKCLQCTRGQFERMKPSRAKLRMVASNEYCPHCGIGKIIIEESDMGLIGTATTSRVSMRRR